MSGQQTTRRVGSDACPARNCVSFGLLAGGCALVAIDQTQRDDDGYLMSPSRDFSTPTYAIVSERANIDVEGAKWAVAFPERASSSSCSGLG